MTHESTSAYFQWGRSNNNKCAIMTRVPISISIPQTFLSCVAIFHLRPPMEFSSHNSSDTSGLLLLWMLYLRAMQFSIKLKLCRQGYVKERLKSFYSRYVDLIKQYEVSLSQMLHDIQGDSYMQWKFPLHQFCDLLTNWTLLPNLTFYLIVQGFHR